MGNPSLLAVRVAALLLLLSTANPVAAQCSFTWAVGATFDFSGVCTPANVLAGLKATYESTCELADIGQTEETIDEICEDAAVPFGDITDTHSYQFDNNFMDGGGKWNTEDESLIPMSFSATRLERFRQFGSDYRIQWPKYQALWDYSNPVDPNDESALFYGEEREPYMSNFNFTDSCQLRTAMCCFVEARREDNPLIDNANLCHHNIEDSKRSSHLNKGFAVYDDEMPAYCVGFSWDDDPYSVSNLYKGNALYDISFGTFYDQGWRKNIPGAPMCGCIEKMPTVSKADCTEISVTGVEHTFTVAEDDEQTITFAYIEQTAGDVIYDDCPAASLRSHFQGTPEEVAALQQRLPTDCEESRETFLNKWFLVKGTTTQWDKPDPTKWEAMYGRGLSYVPRMSHPTEQLPYDMDKEEAFFRAKLAASALPNIVYRHCESCHESHQHIYYKRLTPVPPAEEFSYLELFLFNWKNENNVLGVDFELYSTLDDALQGQNEWKYCNYNSRNVGFPRDCGPIAYTPCQWSTHFRKSVCNNVEYTSISHAFYVAKPLPM